MALQLSWTDATQTLHPQAYLVIQDAQAQMGTKRGTLSIAIYHDAATAAPSAQASPLYTDTQVVLTPAEVDQLASTFMSELYTILNQRPAFSTAVIVP